MFNPNVNFSNLYHDKVIKLDPYINFYPKPYHDEIIKLDPYYKYYYSSPHEEKITLTESELSELSESELSELFEFYNDPNKKKPTATKSTQTYDFTPDDTFIQLDKVYENDKANEKKDEIIYDNINDFNKLSHEELINRFEELKLLNLNMTNNMEILCDFTSEEEAKIKQEYIELEELIMNHDDISNNN
jgi:hypothetical protein